ncbi:MAG: TIGR04222 domain-containing membrane protein, partial [Planctomycetota bacterium]
MPIDPRQQALWDRILGHRFDDPAARLTFTARLARENAWTIGYAVRVVDEYRRFVFLAMTAGHAVTPSEDVDQAWHLHLAYTHDYWEIFCSEVLRRPLHHGPTRGGAVEAERYDQQYRRTLSAYAAAFDAPPPNDIWPPPERRFGSDLEWRRVNVASNWVIPKPRWLVGRRRVAPLAGLATAPLVAAGIPNPLDLTGPPFLALFAMLATGSIVVGLVLRRLFQPLGDPTVTDQNLEPLELALLADDGRWRCAASGLSALAVAPAATVTGGTKSEPPSFAIVSSPPPESPPLLRALHARLAALGSCTTAEAVKAAVDVVRDEFEPALIARGLLVGEWWKSASPWLITAPAAATIGLGIAKIFTGVSRGKPVGFLVIGCITLGFVCLIALAKKPRRTRQGDAVVHTAWKRFRESGQQATWAGRRRTEPAVQPIALMPLAVALLGTAALGGTTHAFLQAPIDRLQTGSGSGAGGCGSSGGCGGGGGGGCGG